MTPRGPTLVGRDREVAVLEAELNRTTSGEFRIVLLLGDPGVGKTRLAGEILMGHRATVLGLSARAHPLGLTTAFGLWAEAFEGHLRTLDPKEVSALCGGFVGDLGGLLHSAAACAVAPSTDTPRARLVEGLTVLLGSLARRSPVLVLLDDVHLADASSWEALAYLARNVSGSPVLILAAARPVELADHPVAAQVLLALDQEGFVSRLELAPLEIGALGRLAEETLLREVPSGLVDWLEQRSRGNPLFALGLLRALQEEGADLSAPRLHRLPEGLADRVTTRAKALDEPARSTLDLLAVLGRRIGLGELIALSARPLERLAPILDSLVGARLVVEEERGQQVAYEIAHPLFQEAIYQGLGGARRRVLHREVARGLLSAGRAGEAAPHFARSAEVGDDEAIAAVCEALRLAEDAGAFREALSILAVLVDLVPQGDARWLNVLDAMAPKAEWVLDHRSDMHAVLGIRALRAIDAVMRDSPDVARRAAVKLRLGSFLTFGTGELEEGERCCDQAIELFQVAGDIRGALLATTERAYVEMIKGNVEAGGTRMSGVVVAAGAAGDRFVLLQALAGVGWSAWFCGRFDEAESAFERAMAMARADANDYRLPYLLMALGDLCALDGRIEDARRLFAEGRAAGPAWREGIPQDEILVDWLAGDFRAAMARADEWITWNAEGMSRRRSETLGFAAIAALEMGETTEAVRYLALANAAHGGRDWFDTTVCSRYGEAVLGWRQGRRGEALSGLRRVASGLLDKGLRPYAAFALTDLAELAAEDMRADVAREAVVLLDEIAGELDRNLYRALAELARASAALASGAPHHAAGPARSCVELLTDTGYRVFCARALDALGHALTGHDRSGAVEALERAAEFFEGCGAVVRRDHALDALRRLGSRGQRAAAAVLGASSLTPRERQVARLAAEGHTLRQIGTRLYIGERTVETHLARSYAKLGVKSKSELVERAAELGL